MSPHLDVDLDTRKLDDQADALQDQQYGEHTWRFDPRTGEAGPWSRDLDDEDDELDAELRGRASREERVTPDGVLLARTVLARPAAG